MAALLPPRELEAMRHGLRVIAEHFADGADSRVSGTRPLAT